jgi:methylated-DNA-[protein]-cysteine S-methyltransferase
MEQLCMERIYVESPVKRLLLEGDEGGIRRIGFDREAQKRSTKAAEGSVLREAVKQLKAYFAGDLHDFDLPLRMEGTPFQLSVWRALREIPYGETISYGELARRIGNPSGSRAVGLANGSNPIAIVVPCHRVIGSNGKLTGYGGGLENKELLLNLERRHGGPQPSLY